MAAWDCDCGEGGMVMVYRHAPQEPVALDRVCFADGAECCCGLVSSSTREGGGSASAGDGRTSAGSQGGVA